VSNCSGLAGYRIFRDGKFIAEVGANVQGYHDIFTADAASAVFAYQVQPFDSLQNIQTGGGFATCSYQGNALISITALPTFTQGLANNVCAEIVGTLEVLTLLVDADGDLAADDSVQFSTPSGRVCHDFSQLQDGTRYNYWFAGKDAQLRTVYSDTTWSIQDNTAPVIQSLGFPEGQNLNGQLWAYSRDLNLELIATDAPPGLITQYDLAENGGTFAQFVLDDPASQISRQISYDLQSSNEQSTRFVLTIRAIDAAGNRSEVVELVVYLQDDQPQIFAFPNPFNPDDSGVTIRLASSDESEVRIYDFYGNLVRTIANKTNAHDFVWDGKNGNGEMVANGGYFCVGSNSGVRFKIAVVKK
jgi:hypothetical protein